MGLVARWGMAVAASVAGFALAWWVCQWLAGLDEGVSLGVAGAVLAVAGWWPVQGRTCCRTGGEPGKVKWQTMRSSKVH